MGSVVLQVPCHLALHSVCRALAQKPAAAEVGHCWSAPQFTDRDGNYTDLLRRSRGHSPWRWVRSFAEDGERRSHEAGG